LAHGGGLGGAAKLGVVGNGAKGDGVAVAALSGGAPAVLSLEVAAWRLCQGGVHGEQGRPPQN
jgi:hypothetical protein